MIERKVIVRNKTGLHARPAANVVNAVNRFKCDVVIKKNGKTANAKSIISLLNLNVVKGDEVLVNADGDDEVEAMDAVINVIKNLWE